MTYELTGKQVLMDHAAAARSREITRVWNAAIEAAARAAFDDEVEFTDSWVQAAVRDQILTLKREENK